MTTRQNLLCLFEDSKFATQNNLCATSDKNTNFNISKNMLCKFGISNSLCSRTVRTAWFITFKVIFAYVIELSSNYFRKDTDSLHR